MSQFGVLPFGGPYGPLGGPGTLSVLGLLPVAANEVIVVYDKPPLADDPEGWNSGTNVRNYVLTPIDPTIIGADGSVHVPHGEFAPTKSPSLANAWQDEDDATQIHVTTHDRMESGVQYDVAVNVKIRGEDCEPFVGPATWRFRALRPGPPRVPRYVQEDRYRDWDNTLFPDDPDQPEGTWRFDDTSDIGLHDEDACLKKRLLRRALSKRGEFTHAPTYGLGPRVKTQAKNGQIQALANELAEQARREPDVVHASAEAVLVNDDRGRGIVRVTLFARRTERRDSRFIYELAIV